MSAFHWVANGNLKVQRDNRKVVIPDGEYLPEVTGWKDPEMWERHGSIRKVAGPPPEMPGGDGCHIHDLHDGKCSRCDFLEAPKAPPPPPPKAPKPPPVVDPESTPEADPIADEILESMRARHSGGESGSIELERKESMPESFEPRELKLTQPEAPIPDFEPAKDQPPSESTTEAAGAEGDALDPKDEDDEEYEPYTQSELKRMKKAELQELAAEYDIVAGDEATKGSLVEMITEAQEAEFKE